MSGSSKNKLSAKFKCAPVFDNNGDMLGTKPVYDEKGFGRYQEICGSGCHQEQLEDFTGKLIESPKCITGHDIHNRAAYGPKSSCKFKCGYHEPSNQKITCICEGKVFY